MATSKVKTPPVTEVADGAFEPIFPVDFSFLLYLLAGSTPAVSTRSFACDLSRSRWWNTGGTKTRLRF
jgi:hypothetical protein